MRKDITNIVNRLAAGAGLDFDLMKTYNCIFDYCKINKTRPSMNDYSLKTGCLYINGALIGRVEPLPARVLDDIGSLYYEGLILEKAGL